MIADKIPYAARRSFLLFSAALGLALALPAQAQETIKIGLVTALSGPIGARR